MAKARREDEWARVTAIVQWQAVHLVGKAPDAAAINPYLAAPAAPASKSAAQTKRESGYAWKMFDEFMARKAGV